MLRNASDVYSVCTDVRVLLRSGLLCVPDDAEHHQDGCGKRREKCSFNHVL